jgi:hypothetical protein
MGLSDFIGVTGPWKASRHSGGSFVALNGGPTFVFTEAVSVLNCEPQARIDEM